MNDRRRQIADIASIAARHIFLPINAIIFLVVGLLVFFGSAQEGVFLGAIVFVNMVLGIAQDVRAWATLERLQQLTALRATRIRADGSEEEVFFEKVQEGDAVRLKLGDQVPCDSTVTASDSMEISESLLTGESGSIAKAVGEKVAGGSIVTAGRGTVRAGTSFNGSAMAHMTRGLTRYTANPSPIQLSINTVITYTLYVLVASIAFVVARGYILHDDALTVVETIGALASILVPQGLIVSTTLLFTFGAVHFLRRDVLLQEVNATEKFGRIKNLCMDKTGTLTENVPTVEEMSLPKGVAEATAKRLTSAYINGSNDSSETILAVRKFLEVSGNETVQDALSFSSWRRFGGVSLSDTLGTGETVLVGSSEAFLPHCATEADRAWLQQTVETHARCGKRTLTVMQCPGNVVPPALSAQTKLSVVAVFVLRQELREGIRDAVDFFQSRGVCIRVLSGDNPDTVQAVARGAGIAGSDTVVTGQEIDTWSEEVFRESVDAYRIFARIQPHQKERIIDVLKERGFTAMVGDGANDALSVKKADLGIAMFDGAPATRQVAAVVLMRNSLIELPAGVRLADSMIENIEIYTGIFLNQTFLGFMLFVVLSALGYPFPLNPLNVSLITFFAIGIPYMLISYWAIRPTAHTKPVSTRPFLKRVLPLPLALSPVQAAGAVFVALYGASLVGEDMVRSTLVLTFIFLGYGFFLLAPQVYTEISFRAQRWQLVGLGAVIAALLFVFFHVPLLMSLYTTYAPSAAAVCLAGGVAAVCAFVQLLIVRTFFSRDESAGK
ncbi:HAD-IC family P-type ATPase [Candidatus Kaiserbacteria bacterium]|nr:HAD-IC family P-type ATPase [Candidatus Kaiserbacteria bacterium]